MGVCWLCAPQSRNVNRFDLRWRCSITSCHLRGCVLIHTPAWGRSSISHLDPSVSPLHSVGFLCGIPQQRLRRHWGHKCQIEPLDPFGFHICDPTSAWRAIHFANVFQSHCAWTSPCRQRTQQQFSFFFQSERIVPLAWGMGLTWFRGRRGNQEMTRSHGSTCSCTLKHASLEDRVVAWRITFVVFWMSLTVEWFSSLVMMVMLHGGHPASFFLSFRLFPFLAFFFVGGVITAWCEKWVNPFGLDLRPALDRKPSGFSSRLIVYVTPDDPTLLNSRFLSYSSFIQSHTALKANVSTSRSISFVTRACVQNSSNTVLVLKIKSNTSKQKGFHHAWTLWTECLVFPEAEGIDGELVVLLCLALKTWHLGFLTWAWYFSVEYIYSFSFFFSISEKRHILHVALVVVMSRHIAQCRIDSVTPSCARLPLQSSRLPRQMLSRSLWCGLERTQTFTVCRWM